jgi:hypothetical protein
MKLATVLICLGFFLVGGDSHSEPIKVTSPRWVTLTLSRLDRLAAKFPTQPASPRACSPELSDQVNYPPDYQTWIRQEEAESISVLNLEKSRRALIENYRDRFAPANWREWQAIRLHGQLIEIATDIELSRRISELVNAPPLSQDPDTQRLLLAVEYERIVGLWTEIPASFLPVVDLIHLDAKTNTRLLRALSETLELRAQLNDRVFQFDDAVARVFNHRGNPATAPAALTTRAAHWARRPEAEWRSGRSRVAFKPVADAEQFANDYILNSPYLTPVLRTHLERVLETRRRAPSLQLDRELYPYLESLGHLFDMELTVGGDYQ